MKLELGFVTSNLRNIIISFPKLEFCKRKGKKITIMFSYLNKVLFSKYMYLLSILSVPVELFTRVSDLAYMPVLKHLQGWEPKED